MTAKRKETAMLVELRSMCKNIADDISNDSHDGGISGASRLMDDIYSVRYIVDSEKKYLGAMLMVAGGGPTIWVNTHRSHVEGSWWGDKCEYYYIDNIGLDDYCQEMYGE